MTDQAAGADPIDVQPTITAYWNIRSVSYDEQPHHSVVDGVEKDAWLADLRVLLPPPPADVLDVGAGTGFLAILLAELGYRVTGIDPAEGMLATARRKAAHLAIPPVFEVGDGHAVPFPDERFDVVANRHVLWTLRDPARAFREWRRVLRLGGRLVAIDSLWFLNERRDEPDSDDSPWRAAWRSHYSDAVRAGLPLMHIENLDPALALLGDAGFTDVRVSRLEAVEQLDRERAPDTQHLPRYAITAVRGE